MGEQHTFFNTGHVTPPKWKHALSGRQKVYRTGGVPAKGEGDRLLASIIKYWIEDCPEEAAEQIFQCIKSKEVRFCMPVFRKQWIEATRDYSNLPPGIELLTAIDLEDDDDGQTTQTD